MFYISKEKSKAWSLISTWVFSLWLSLGNSCTHYVDDVVFTILDSFITFSVHFSYLSAYTIKFIIINKHYITKILHKFIRSIVTNI
jgi:hypothetical protein